MTRLGVTGWEQSAIAFCGCQPNKQVSFLGFQTSTPEVRPFGPYVSKSPSIRCQRRFTRRLLAPTITMEFLITTIQGFPVWDEDYVYDRWVLFIYLVLSQFLDLSSLLVAFGTHSEKTLQKVVRDFKLHEDAG